MKASSATPKTFISFADADRAPICSSALKLLWPVSSHYRRIDHEQRENEEWTDRTRLDRFLDAIAAADTNGATIADFLASPADASTIAKIRTTVDSNRTLLQVDPTAATRRLIAGVPLYVSPAVGSGSCGVSPVIGSSWQCTRSRPAPSTGPPSSPRTAPRSGPRCASISDSSKPPTWSKSPPDFHRSRGAT